MPDQRNPLVSLLIAVAFLSSPLLLTAQQMPETFGAEANPTGAPIGGGEGYPWGVEGETTQAVQTKAELLDGLADASSGDVVRVAPDASINLTGEVSIVIPAGVTLAGDRGRDGGPGGLLFTDAMDTMPLFEVGGPGVRVTGLRLRGPDPERRTKQLRRLLQEEGRPGYYSVPNSRGIQSDHPDLEVDNCELSGFSHAAIFLRQGATGAHIHHNHIHHNQRYALGYGVCLDGAQALIEANRFDWCRHHIAGTGRPGTSYEARYNLVLGNANSHSFDMHGGADRKDGTDIAGDRIDIHHNTFHAIGVEAVVIRGVPQDGARIHHNRFLHEKKAVRQRHATGGIFVFRNRFGAEGRLVEGTPPPD